MNAFKVTDKFGRSAVYTLPEEDGRTATIGRSPQCDIALVEDGCLSRTHCEVRYWGGLLYLRDCHSSNGTRLDGELITQEVMLPGRVFVIGESSVCLAEDWEVPSAPAPEPEPEWTPQPPPPPAPEPEPEWAPQPPPPPAPEPEPEWSPQPPPPPAPEPEPEWTPQPPPPPAPEPEPEWAPQPPPPPAPEPEPAPVPESFREDGTATLEPQPAAEPQEAPAPGKPAAPMPGHKLVKVRRTHRSDAKPAAPRKGKKPAKSLVCAKETTGASAAHWGLPVHFTCTLSLHTTTPSLWEGDTLQFAFSADRDCYLHLLQWDADGNLDVLVGSQGLEQDNFVPAGAERPFPPLRDRTYDFIVEPPFGEDLIVAVACTAPCQLDAALLAQAADPQALSSPVAMLMSAIHACDTGAGEQWSAAFLRLTTHEGLRPGVVR